MPTRRAAARRRSDPAGAAGAGHALDDARAAHPGHRADQRCHGARRLRQPGAAGRRARADGGACLRGVQSQGWRLSSMSALSGARRRSGCLQLQVYACILEECASRFRGRRFCAVPSLLPPAARPAPTSCRQLARYTNIRRQPLSRLLSNSDVPDIALTTLLCAGICIGGAADAAGAAGRRRHVRRARQPRLHRHAQQRRGAVVPAGSVRGCAEQPAGATAGAHRLSLLRPALRSPHCGPCAREAYPIRADINRRRQGVNWRCMFV